VQTVAAPRRRVSHGPERAATDLVEAPGRGGRPWWWRPRVRSALLLGVVAVVAGLARIWAQWQTSWLWYHELGQERVFWTMLASKWLTAGLAGTATTTFLLANFWVVERTAPRDAQLPRDRPSTARLRRVLLPAYLALSVGGGVFVGRSVVRADWQQVVLWLHRSDFGVTDPLFHRDVGFFVFSLPLYQKVAGWLLLTVALALASSFAAHAATGAIRTKPAPLAGTRAAHAHLLGLGGLLLLVTAWEHRLGQFALELPREGAKLPGAAYTDVHVVLPWLRGLVFVSLGGAAMLFYGAVRRSRALPAVALVVVAFAELANPAILPSVVQRFFVDPQTLSRERPYIAHSVRLTQLAYELDRVTDRPLPAHAEISAAELRSNRDVLRNIQLWDTDVLRPQIDQQQSIGSYYSFPTTTVDRYRKQHGGAQAMILAQRELDLGRLEPSGRTWANDRLAYTHGYGLVAAPAGGLGRAGQPRFVTSEFGAGRAPTRVRQPRIYFGLQPRGAEPWVIAGTKRSEIEKPLPGDAPQPEYHYDGGGGIPLSSPARRAVFALRFGELNIALSNTLGNGSRIILHRDVRDRLRTLAPFLRWEKRPEVVVVRGRIQFLAHGYTTSDSFPYSAPVAVGGKAINYMRGAVVATVDAFSGHVSLYVADTEDPILRAWRGAFPTLFAPATSMPAAVRAHLRYPRELFDAQSTVWATYHIDNVEDFYTKSDAWRRPAEISGPVQKVGAIRFRSKRRSPSMRPYFLLARLPGERRQRFMLTTVYTPHSQENLSGYLTGTMDARGGPRLTQLTLPRSRLVLGPSQVSRRILATPAVGDRLRLLNQETADLGRQAVNAVELSEPRVVPIGDSFLYVQPIYVTAQGSGVTRVRLVTVYLNGRVGYGRTLRQAIRRARAGRT
jgi:uncharacterized membrane protein (UPF0182 family)